MKNILLFLFAVLLITLFSTCSFLYPLNPWDDANVYMTIGNAMLDGKELYVDIFDHKGPVLFFLHEWAATLSRSSFVGIYLVEIVCCYFYLYYSLRTIQLFSDPSQAPRKGRDVLHRGHRGEFVWLFLIGLLTYTSDFFSYGDSVEEFALPILAHSLYHMLCYAKERQLPGRTHAFVMGIGIALIFWMKFNLLFFYVGGILALLYIAKKREQTKELWMLAAWTFAGFVLVTALVLAYFVIHGSTDALWESYFLVNIFQYHGSATNGMPDVWWFKFVKLGGWLLLMMPALFLRVSEDVKLLVFATYGVLLLSFATLTVQFYYFLTIFSFFPLLITYFNAARRRELVSPHGWKFWSGVSVVVVLAVSTNWNFVTLLNGTFPHRVLEMAEIINANESEDSEVLTFSSYDTGIYQHTRHLPPNKNFFLSSILDPNIKVEQKEWVESGKIKYLVRVIGAVNTCHDYYDAPVPANYKLVYDKEELFRYRFATTPHKFLWNLTWPRPLLKYIMEPVTVNQRMQVYERRP